RVDCPKLTPGRLLTGRVAKHSAVSIPNWSSKSVVGTGPVYAAPIVGLRRSISASVIATFPFLLNPPAQSCVMCLHEDKSGLGIRSHATPIRAAVPGENDGASRRCTLFMEQKGCKWSRIVEAACLFVDVHTGLCMFRSSVFGRNDVFLF